MSTSTNEYPGLTILARQAMERAREGLPPDVGLVVFTVHFGDGGGLAYTSTCDRAGAISMVVEWLRRQAGESSGHREDVMAAFNRWFGPEAR